MHPQKCTPAPMKTFKTVNTLAFTFAGMLCAMLCSINTQLHAQTPAEPTPLRVLIPNATSLPKALIAKFEADNNIKVQLIKGGDTGEALNKLILSRAAPIADVMFGVDNSLAAKARAAGVFTAYLGPAAKTPNAFDQTLGDPLVAVDYGYVNINIDTAAFAKTGLALPTSLADLALPAYKNMLVVQHPATSSTGYAFMLATIAGLGEVGAFEWWGKMRANGVKVAKGWTEAYYTDFSRNKGAYPLVVSYASSPAAEVFYSKEPLATAPTQNLFIKGGVWRQVEGVALVKGGLNADAGIKFIEFLRAPAMQSQLQTSQWMLPVVAGTPIADAFKHASVPQAFDTLSAREIETKGAEWVKRFSSVVLR